MEVDGDYDRDSGIEHFTALLGEKETFLNTTSGGAIMTDHHREKKRGVALHILSILFTFLIILLMSCAIERQDLATILSNVSKNFATILLNIEQSVSTKTLVPDIDMNPASYRISGLGPNGSSFDRNEVTQQVEIPSLQFGEWTVSVTAKNTEGTPVGTGEEKTILHAGEKKNLKILIKPIQGYGAVDLTVLWTAGEVEYPSIEAQLTPYSGSPIDLYFDIPSDGTAVYQSGYTIPTGYHTLSVKLLDNGISVMGAVEVVRIVNKKTTYGTFEFFEINQQGGDVMINITPELENPLEIVLSGNQDVVELGGSMTVDASVTNESGNVLFTWYINGDFINTGSSYVFTNDLTPGIYRLDVRAYTEDGVRSGSTSHVFQVVEVNLTQATLLWDPNTEPDLAGYKIYYGYVSGGYEYSVDVGNQTTYTLTGLDPNQTYYISATAYNIGGYESDFSNEVVFPVNL